MKSIVVFCGASAGEDEIYVSQARALGAILAERKTDIIYSGARNRRDGRSGRWRTACGWLNG